MRARTVQACINASSVKFKAYLDTKDVQLLIFSENIKLMETSRPRLNVATSCKPKANSEKEKKIPNN